MAKSKSKAAAKTTKPTGTPAKAKQTLFERKSRQFHIGGAIQPKRDLGRFVKWPKYIRLQRQAQVLKRRLKVPPSINQFTQTVDKNTATQIFRLLSKYKPEDKAQKKARLQAAAAAKASSDADAAGPKPLFVKFGLNHVTALIEQKKAQLVIIAHDVDPIETVVWLPALCRKMDVPYCIVKGKARLGMAVNKKNATCLAVTGVKKEDQTSLAKLVDAVRNNYNLRFDEIRRTWGGGIMGEKTNVKVARQERARQREIAARMR